MKKILTFLFIAMLSIGICFGNLWRVNNMPGVDADFSSITAAQSSASVVNGDTIYLEPSAGTYGNITFTKKLIVIGNGYFLTENPETQANINTSRLGTITYNAGSQGSVVIGCQIDYIALNTSNIVIERNYFNVSSGADIIIFNTNNISNIIIRNNYILHTGSHYTSRSCIYTTSSGITNVFINNNYIKMTNAGLNAFSLGNGFSGTIENNVIDGNIIINNANFNNNIQVTGNFTQTNCTYTNNLGNSTQFGTANGNQQNVNMVNVFKGPTGNTTDSQWQLKTGSPAIGAGVGGIDCGMYGGTFPYRLSGLPGFPAIYQHTQTIDYNLQKINVNISVKSHN